MRNTFLAPTLIGWTTMTALGSAIPWPEHPRPDFKREPWVNLNGAWGFAFDPDDVGVSREWHKRGEQDFSRRITVPYPWESRLSGIGDTDYQGVAWYARPVTLPSGEGWDGKDIWLVVGACDWEAKVWVNGQLACEHVGGYTPFDINLAPFAKPGEMANIVIRAVDRTDPQQPTGKQIHWYTRTSGIWQTVYLEARAGRFIESVQAVPNLATGSMSYSVKISGDKPCRVALVSPEGAFERVKTTCRPGEGPAELTLKPNQPKAWSPDSPHLYDAHIELADEESDVSLDAVHTYFGLREVSVGDAPGGDYQHIHLNGKPVYLRGALHQSFHPEAIYQYPDDAAVRRDYEIAKQFGLNFLRIHIKVPTPRELYWADRLGILIMSDMPNTWAHTDQAREWWELTMRAAIHRDFNHPSIFSWCLFNETWGLGGRGDIGPYDAERQEWVKRMYHLAKRLDPTRLVEDNSPCNYDHVLTDINSWHFYINDYAKARDHIQKVVDETYPGSEFNYIGEHRQSDAPLINSEYGGISAGLGDQDISWCFKYLTNELRKHDKIGGYIYTELTDIEWEHNGFANYDRTLKEYGYDFWHPGFTPADINNPDFVVIDAPPMIEFDASGAREVPILVSHWSGKKIEKPELRYRVEWIDRYAERHEGAWEAMPAELKRYQVVRQRPIQVKAFDRGGPAIGALLVELVDGDRVVARNYVNVLTAGAPTPVEAIDDGRVVIRFAPASFAERNWSDDTPSEIKGIAADKVCAQGTGYVEYHVMLPKDVDPKKVQSIELLAELSAKAGDEKLAWPARKKDVDYPQTDNTKWPSDLRIAINGQAVHEVTLHDDPADARGALSHHHQHHPGSYGYLTRVEVSGDTLARILATDPHRLTIRFEVPKDAKHPGGLAIFGHRLGRYPLDPTVIVRR